MDDATASQAARDARRLLEAVTREFSLEDPTLPDEFFPAHLPAALMGAVFATRPTEAHARQRPSGDFCRHFGIASERPDRWRIPERSTQYTMTEFIRDCRTLETDALEQITFGSDSRFPGTNRFRAQVLLDAAEALRDAGAEVLQDVRDRSPVFVRKVLAPVAGEDSELARWLLMYCGTDRFVLGDGSVRRFVACATGRTSVAGKEAEALLRYCAYELALSPRYLDYLVHVGVGDRSRKSGRVERSEATTARTTEWTPARDERDGQ